MSKSHWFWFFDFCFFWFFSSSSLFGNKRTNRVPHGRLELKELLWSQACLCCSSFSNCYRLLLSLLPSVTQLPGPTIWSILSIQRCLIFWAASGHKTSIYYKLETFKMQAHLLTKQQQPLEEWSWCPSHKHEIAYTLWPKVNIFMAFQDTNTEIPPSDALSLPSGEALCSHLGRALNSFTSRLTVPSEGMSTRPSYSLVWQTLTWQQCRQTIKELHP